MTDNILEIIGFIVIFLGSLSFIIFLIRLCSRNIIKNLSWIKKYQEDKLKYHDLKIKIFEVEYKIMCSEHYNKPDDFGKIIERK